VSYYVKTESFPICINLYDFAVFDFLKIQNMKENVIAVKYAALRK